jgi:hypothetical protein
MRLRTTIAETRFNCYYLLLFVYACLKNVVVVVVVRVNADI